MEDLKEYGIKSILAQSLFKHIVKWKASGVPAEIFTQHKTNETEVVLEGNMTSTPANEAPKSDFVNDVAERQREEAENQREEAKRQREAVMKALQERCERAERERDAAQKLVGYLRGCADRKHTWLKIEDSHGHSRCEGCRTWGYRSRDGEWREGY